jgi:hypothetical protein
MNNRDLRKRVDCEQKFADYVFKSFKQKRYGICSPVIEEQLDKYTIKKQLYQWSDWYNPKSYQIEYEESSWNSSEEDFPEWIVGACNNGCAPQQIFTPDAAQLANEGGQYWNESGGINNYSSIVPSSELFNLPNDSGHPLITIRSRIDYNQLLATAAFNTDVSGIPIMAVQSEGYLPSGTTVNGVLWNNLPAYNPIISQFYLLPNPSGIIMPHFTYPDPHPYSTMATIEHTELGTLYYDSNAVDTFYFTMFGNSLNITENWSVLNGGLYFDAGGAFEVPLTFSYNDGNNSYNVTTGATPVLFGNPYSPYFDINSELYDPTLNNGTILPPLVTMNAIQFATAPVCIFIPLAGTFNYNGLFNEAAAVLSSDLCELPGYVLQYDQNEITPEINIIDPTLIASVCNEDIETILIQAVNQNGDPVQGYEIILDGGNVGFTDQFGKFTATIKNASEITNHTINVCYCFTTVGQCAQSQIKLVITEDGTIDNTLNKSDCINISESE